MQSKDQIAAYRDIEALIDGELDRDRARELLQKIKNDSSLKLRYEILKSQKDLLQDWWANYKRND